MGLKVWHPDLATLGGVYTGQWVSLDEQPNSQPRTQGGREAERAKDGRAPTVQGDGVVVTSVLHLMQAQLVGHVCYLVFLVRCLAGQLHLLLLITLRKCISRLGEAAVKDLHDAMGVAVVVDWAAHAWRPHKYQLCKSTTMSASHTSVDQVVMSQVRESNQVALPISFVNQVPGVCGLTVGKGILQPPSLLCVICSHCFY